MRDQDPPPPPHPPDPVAGGFDSTTWIDTDLIFTPILDLNFLSYDKASCLHYKARKISICLKLTVEDLGAGPRGAGPPFWWNICKRFIL